MAQLEERPAYRKLEGIMRAVPWSMSSKPLGERLAWEAQFVRRSLGPLPDSQKLDD